MKLLIISDAASPQVNGVVRTIETTIGVLESKGWEVLMIHPGLFKTMPTPGYPEIRMVLSTKGLAEMMTGFDPDYVHIATEGRLGWAARALCIKMGWRFTTAYHTDFPTYLKKHFGIPASLTYKVVRRFHSAAAAVMVATPTVEAQLRAQGFDRIKRWGRGVDTSLFVPRLKSRGDGNCIMLNVGRVSREKNLEAFLDLKRPGTKVIVGDGPMLETYKQKYPGVIFMGALKGEALSRIYAMADVFVFPSLSDTFGLVIIEALASGTPVAAFPVQGPLDILTDESGFMSPDLDNAIDECYSRDRVLVARHGQSFTWERATEQFIGALVRR